jgi:hypothetical protein
MRLTAQLAISVGLALAAACTPPAPQQPQRTQAVISSSYDRVWSAAVGTVGMNFPIQSTDKTSGLITTAQTKPHRGNWGKYIGGTWGVYDVRVSINVLVGAMADGRTSVAIKCNFTEFSNKFNLFANEWGPAKSTGALENELLTAIENALAR